MVIKTIDNPPVKNMTGDSATKKTAKDMAENSTAKNTSKDYYFHNNKRSQAKNNAYVITKATVKDKSVKICGYDEEGLLIGWGMNNRVIYSRVDNECIAGWFEMMCENDNLVVGEILKSVEEYKLRHSKAKDITAKAEHNTANAEEIEGDSIAKNSVAENIGKKNGKEKG